MGHGSNSLQNLIFAFIFLHLRRNIHSTMKNRRIFLLILLIVQNTLSALLGRYIRSSRGDSELFSISHFVLTSEMVKLIFSIFLEILCCDRNGYPTDYIYTQPTDTLKMAIPSLLYLGSNTLLYVALTNLTVPTFQIASQLKLVVTAVVSFLILDRKYSIRQWSCLILISFGLGIIATENAAYTRKQDESTSEDDTFVGLGAIGLSCLFSALAGVYFEKWVKARNEEGDPQKPLLSLWLRNIQLAAWSLAFSCVQCFVVESEMHTPFFQGFDVYVWTQICLLAFGGLLVASVIKYTDNVMKGLATGMSTLLSIGFSVIFFKNSLSSLFLSVAACVVMATYFFLNPNSVAFDNLFSCSISQCMMIITLTSFILGIQRALRFPKLGQIILY